MCRAEQVEGDHPGQAGGHAAPGGELFVQQVEGQLVEADAVALRQADQARDVQAHAECFEHQLVKGVLRVVTRRVGGVEGEGGKHLGVAGAPGLQRQRQALPVAVEPVESVEQGDFFQVVAPQEQLAQQCQSLGSGAGLQHLGQQQGPRQRDHGRFQLALALAAQQCGRVGVRLLHKPLLRLLPPLLLGVIQLLAQVLAMFGEAILAHVHVGLIQR